MTSSTTNAIINLGFAWRLTDKRGKQKAEIGTSFFGVNRPKTRLLSETARDRVVYSVHGSMEVPLGNADVALVPNFRWTGQGHVYVANIGARLRHDLKKLPGGSLSIGLWYSTNKSGILSVEFGTQRYVVGLAYNNTLHNNAAVSTVGNAWEIGLVWKFGREVRRAVDRPLVVTETLPTETTPPAIDQFTPESEPAEQPLPPSEEPLPDATTPSDGRRITELNSSDQRLLRRTVQFPINSAVVNKDGQGLVDSLVTLLNNHPDVKLLIKGHTCNLGSKKVNAGISLNRARAVKALFIKRGISGTRIQTIGMDFQKPLNTNVTAEERAANRRVEFELIE